MAGAGYKLFATGDVLTASDVNTYLMQQTVMVFADAAARTTALSGVVAEGMLSYLKDTNAVEVYDGANWVASDDPNAIQNTIVAAKGDIIGASANDVPAVTSVGADGTTLVADSSTSTGLRYTAGTVQANPFLNSSTQIWQRGTSISLAASTLAYTADRWVVNTPAGCASTISRQLTSDSTNLPFIQYCARVQRNSGQTGAGYLDFTQMFETLNTIPFAGKTVTLSFYARRGANYSATSNLLTVRGFTGTGTDQSLYSGYTGSAQPLDSSATLTTTWQRFTFTFAIAATATEMSYAFTNQTTGTAGAADYFEITGVQLDIGSVALPFRTYAGTIQGELAACQRYYQRIGANASYAFSWVGVGQATSTTVGKVLSPLATSLRGAPSVARNGNFAVNGQAVTAVAIDQVGFASGNATTIALAYTVASGLTNGSSCFVYANNDTTASIELSSEL